VKNLDGVSYVNPQDIVCHILATALPKDYTTISKQTPLPHYDRSKTIYRMTECKAFIEAEQRAIKYLEDDVPLVLLWATKWGDGCGINRSKQNQNPIDIGTMTVATPPNRTNTTYNTFPLGVGMKKKKGGWAQFQQCFQKDLAGCCNPKHPLVCHHGGLKKTAHVKSYFDNGIRRQS